MAGAGSEKNLDIIGADGRSRLLTWKWARSMVEGQRTRDVFLRYVPEPDSSNNLSYCESIKELIHRSVQSPKKGFINYK